MLEPMDIEHAKNLFKEWDLHHRWHIPSSTFIHHSKKKAKESLELAEYLLHKIENTEELEDNDSTSIWIITQSKTRRKSMF